jgi:NADH-quinone oxidoreductase subunit D
LPSLLFLSNLSFKIVYLIYNSVEKSYICETKVPRFGQLQALERMSKRYIIADVFAVIGTQDIVSFEVD